MNIKINSNGKLVTGVNYKGPYTVEVTNSPSKSYTYQTNETIRIKLDDDSLNNRCSYRINSKSDKQ